MQWRAFPQDTVIAIAEAWNSGLTTAKMAEDLNCKPSTLRVVLGKLAQLGVKLRKGDSHKRRVSTGEVPHKLAGAMAKRLEEEARYKALRDAGVSPNDVREIMALSQARAAKLSLFYRLDTDHEGFDGRDNSCPKFSRDDLHVATVWAQGGFWAFSEKRVGKDGLAICLPLIKPRREEMAA